MLTLWNFTPIGSMSGDRFILVILQEFAQEFYGENGEKLEFLLYTLRKKG